MNRGVNQNKKVNEPLQNSALLYVRVVTKNVAKKNVQRKKA